MTDIDYIAARRNRGTPAQGKPLDGIRIHHTARPQYRNPRICRKECAAEYWRALVDLLMIPNAHPERAQIEAEAQTWHRFATTPHAFGGGNQ